jgi:prevent-host-death family protein
MVEVTVQQAALRIEELLERAAAGEEVVMVRAGRPVAKLVSCAPTPPRGEGPPSSRVPGRLAGKIVIHGDFNAPLPDDLLDAFES